MVKINIGKVTHSLKRLKLNIRDKKVLVFAILLLLFIFIPLTFAAQKTKSGKAESVLGISSRNVPATPTPIPTASLTPTPTPGLLKNISVSTPTPIPTSPATPTSTPAPNSVSSSSSPTNTPTPVPTSTPTPTPTPAGLNVQIGIDYAGNKPSDSYNTTLNSGQTAWEAVSSAIGISNLQYTDYGGDMGIFITGFNGVSANSNQYYEFRVNGVSSSVGVSSYNCNDGDKLDFVLITF